MNILKTIVFALLIIIGTQALAQTKEKGDFVKRFDHFLRSETAKLSWSATDSANTLPVPMPNALDASKTRVPEPVSGLWFYPNISKVYDPKTGFYIAYDAGHYYQYKANTASGKIYKGKKEVEIKRIKQDEE